MRKALLRTLSVVSLFAILLSTVAREYNTPFTGNRGTNLAKSPMDGTFKKSGIRQAAGANKSPRKVLRPTSVVTSYANCVGTATFSYSSNDLQSFKIPTGVTSVNIKVIGANGGNMTDGGAASGGKGAIMQGSFDVSSIAYLSILVGQKGGDGNLSGGGGGGSFVFSAAMDNAPYSNAIPSNLLIAAGGGGGGGIGVSPGSVSPNAEAKKDANIIRTANYGYQGGTDFAGGSGNEGEGGSFSLGATGGAGINSNGGTNDPGFEVEGFAPMNGGMGGGTNPSWVTFAEYGGYGGGGCSYSNSGGGGGGGYSGGGGGAPDGGYGGGGGSYILDGVTNENPQEGVGNTDNTGNGLVVITWALPQPSIFANSNSPLNEGATLNLNSTSGFATYSWTGPGGFTSTAQNPVRNSVTAAHAGTYTVTGTDANGCTATASTAVVVNASIPATALNFDGVNDKVVVNNTTLGNFGTGDFTVEMSIRTTGTGIQYLATKRGVCGGDNFWSLQMVNGKLNMEMQQGAGPLNYVALVGNTTINNGVWHHVALTRQSGNVNIYVDGALELSSSATIANISNPYALEFGSSVCNGQNGSVKYIGDMDEIRIWSRALCTEELDHYRHCELTLPQTGLQAYYKLNAGYLNANNAGVTTAVDATGSNDATLTNFGLTGAASNWVAGTISGTCASFATGSATISGNATICVGSTTQLSASPSGGTWVSSNTAIANVNGTGLVNGVAAGSVTITYTSLCGAVATKAVTVNAQVTPAFTQVAAICSGASLAALPTTSTNNISGTWSPALNNTATTTYTFTPSAGQCATTATMTITVTPNNTITLSSAAGTDAQAKCVLTAITDITYATTGATGATFSGLPAGVSGSWSGNVVTISGTPSVLGSFNYTVTLTGGCGNITANGSLTVNTIAAPTGVSATPLSVCSGGSSNLNATSAGNTINWYTASSGGTFLGSSASGANFAVSPSSATTYYAETQGVVNNSQTYSYTGAPQTFTVPAGVTSITIDAYGAAGGNAGGGAGGQRGRVQGVLSVTPGQVITIYVGGTGSTTSAGYNGGGAGNYTLGAGGGGASDIRIGGTALTNRVLVAGGGGGGGNHCGSADAYGGKGGGLIGQTGFLCASQGSNVGEGGSQVAGGISRAGAGTAGVLGVGGNGGSAGGNFRGGGGGGGYYGGGGASSGGGGGGSSYTDPSMTGVVHTQGSGTGNGQIIITYSSAGCISPTRTSVTVNITPNNTATLSSAVGTDAQTKCINTSITPITYATTGATGATFSGLPAGVTGTWTSTGGVNGVITISGAPAATANYTVTLTGGCGTVTVSGSITVTTPVTPTFTQVAAICSGASLAALPTTSVNGISGTWYPALNNTATTAYTFTPNAGQCGTTATMTISVNPLPSVPVGTDGARCGTGAVPLSASIVAGETIDWYDLSSGGSILSGGHGTTTFTTPSISATTIYYAHARNTTTGCVSASRTAVTATVNSVPSVSVTPATPSIVSGNSVNLAATGATTYSWSPSTGLSATTGGTVTANPTVTTTYTVTGTNAIGGCQSVASVTVTVINCSSSGSATFAYSGNTLQTFKIPDGVTSVKIKVIGANGGDMTSGAMESGGKGAIMQGTFDVTSITHLSVLVGQKGGNGGLSGGGGGGSFVFSATTANAPYSNATQSNLLIAAGGGGGGGIGVSPGILPPNAQAKKNANITRTANYGYQGGTDFAGGSGNESYGGSFSLGATGGAGINSNGGTNDPGFEVEGFAPMYGGMGGGTNPLYVTFAEYGGFGGGGCSYSNSGGGGGGGYSGGGGGAPDGGYGGGGGSYILNGVTNENPQEGVGTTETSGDGLVTITWTVQAVSVSATTNSPVCEGSTINLTASSDFASYNWTGPNGFTSALQNPTISNAAVAAAGIYTVEVTAENGCTYTANTTVVVNPKPSAPVVTVVDNCDGTSTLSTTATGSLLWSTGETTSSITVNTAGYYSVTTSVNGCTSLSGTGSASPKTTPATPSVTVVDNCDGTSTLSTTATGSLLWSTGETTSSITVNTAGYYSVTTSVNGWWDPLESTCRHASLSIL